MANMTTPIQPLPIVQNSHGSGVSKIIYKVILMDVIRVF